MKRSSAKPKYVVCVDNDDYPVSLVVRRIYQVVPDAAANRRGLLRVIDETGEDYLYSKKLFATVEISSTLSRKLAGTV